MNSKVAGFIAKEGLLNKEGLHIVALSGGADSVALLLILKQLGYRIEAAHCNFRLRGEESDRDESFVCALCESQNIPIHRAHFDTREYAALHKMSIEMAARELRYHYFEQLRQDLGADTICVAHHRDDAVETLLMNLMNGTGIHGLTGIRPKNGYIVRPLLCLSREEILKYLESKRQSYVTDSTNSERIAQRNRLRLDVMPLLRSINPSAIEHLCLACDNVRQSLPYYKKGIEAAFKEQSITADTFPLSALNSQTLLHEWLAGKGFNRTQEEEMLQEDLSTPFRGRNCGKMWHSDTHTVLRDRNVLLLAPRSLSIVNCQLSIKEDIVSCIGETGPDIAYFDADLLTEPIKVRSVREGDAFVPFGMKGRKLVSDFLTDRKVNRLQKAETFVATCGDDIIWLIGYRSDNRFRVSDKTTRILKLTLANNLQTH